MVDDYATGADRLAVLTPWARAAADALLDVVERDDLETVTALAWFHWYRQRETSDPDDGRECAEIAVQLFLVAGQAAPDTPIPPELRAVLDARYAARSLTLDDAHRLVAEAEADPAPGTLDAAVDLLAGAELLAGETPGDPERPWFRFLWGHLLRVRFERRRDGADLDLAITVLQAAVDAAPGGPEGFGHWYAGLGLALLLRRQRDGTEADSDTAVSALRTALAHLDPDDGDWLVTAQNLGVALLLSGALDDAVHQLTEVVAAAPRGTAIEAEQQVNLGHAHYRRHGTPKGRPKDLDTAVSLLSTVHEGAWPEPAAGRLRAATAPLLAAALFDRFRRDGEQADLVAAEGMVRAALALPESAVRGDRGKYQLLLAGILVQRQRFSGSVADLDEAISIVESLRRPAASGGVRPGGVLHTLIEALVDRHLLTSSRSDIDRAVALGREAVRLSEVTGRPGARSLDLHLLGMALVNRSEVTGSREDLDEAVRMATEAVALLPDGDVNSPVIHGTLAHALRARALYFSHPGDLDSAVAAERGRVVSASASGGTATAQAQVDLGVTLNHRFERLGARADIDEAVDLARAATARMLPSERHAALNLAGIALRNRYIFFGDPADLDSAVDASTAAAESIPTDHSQYGTVLSNLGLTQWTRYRQARRRADIDAAIDSLRAAAGMFPPRAPAPRGHPRQPLDVPVRALRRDRQTPRPERRDHRRARRPR
ncbi:hypothetical protein [Streptomyces brasiliensis]|uniref:hypothetical protein n=1 Tax=Streptomyces brasiliensis TaxID=1954 RepID=UPI001670A688|nr:hypothetical protein [Streptomyces brasiliensis]